jgi:hypothetical protein
MSNFYANICLRTTNQHLAIKALRELNRVAFVSHPDSGWAGGPAFPLIFLSLTNTEGAPQ